MSVYASRVFADRVLVMGDSLAWCPTTGIVQGIVPKTFSAGKLHLVIAGIGDMAAITHYAMNLASLAACGTVDITVGKFKKFMRKEQAARRPLPARSSLLLAGISETRGPFHEHVGCDTWTWRTDLPPFVAGIPLDDDEVAATDIDLDTEAAFVPSTLRLFEAVRRKPVLCGGPAIGGQIVLTTVTAGGFKAEVIAYWNDLLGKVPLVNEPLRRVGAVGPAMMMGLAD